MSVIPKSKPKRQIWAFYRTRTEAEDVSSFLRDTKRRPRIHQRALSAERLTIPVYVVVVDAPPVNLPALP